MLSPKERLLRALHNESTDRPPCICPGGMMNMITSDLMREIGVMFPAAHTDAQKMADLAAAAYDLACFENYGVPFCMTVEAEEMGAKVDLGSEVYEPHVKEYVMQSVADWRDLPAIDMDSGRAKVTIEAIKLLKAKGDDVPIIGNLTGPISTASSLIEPVVFYKALRKEKEEAHAFLRFVTDRLIAFAQKQIEAGADVIAISDPSGTGEILGKKYFEEFAVTYINAVLAQIPRDRVGTVVHICGQMKNVYAQVAQIKSDALSFDSIVSLREARANLPGRVLMGNVSTYALEFGEPEKVAELTKRCTADGAGVISPACGLGMRSPLRNVKSILRVLKQGSE